MRIEEDDLDFTLEIAKSMIYVIKINYCEVVSRKSVLKIKGRQFDI